jgi:hypothetical protein
MVELLINFYAAIFVLQLLINTHLWFIVICCKLTFSLGKKAFLFCFSVSRCNNGLGCFLDVRLSKNLLL